MEPTMRPIIMEPSIDPTMMDPPMEPGKAPLRARAEAPLWRLLLCEGGRTQRLKGERILFSLANQTSSSTSRRK